MNGRRARAALCGLLPTACTAGGAAPPGAAPSTGGPPSAATVTGPPVTGTPVAGQATPRDDAVRRAVTDAASSAGVPPAQVRIVQVVEREWSDGSLGCPEPNRMYTQAIIPGYLVELEAGGRRLEYHADGGPRVIILCQGGRPQAVP